MTLPAKSSFKPVKETLTDAFEAMGPDRVVRGLRARRCDWRSCFLAKAYPECALAASPDGWDDFEWAANTTGLSEDLVAHIVVAFDESRESRRLLREWAKEWLELNREPRHEPVYQGAGAS